MQALGASCWLILQFKFQILILPRLGPRPCRAVPPSGRAPALAKLKFAKFFERTNDERTNERRPTDAAYEIYDGVEGRQSRWGKKGAPQVCGNVRSNPFSRQYGFQIAVGKRREHHISHQTSDKLVPLPSRLLNAITP